MPNKLVKRSMAAVDAPPSYDSVVSQSITGSHCQVPDSKQPISTPIPECPTPERDGIPLDVANTSSRPSTRAWASSAGLSLPVVIPQTTKVFRGAFFSPFVRAWTPELQGHGIEQEDFLTFIDGLNEAWINHPIFEGLGLVGGVLGMVYGVHPVQIAGGALQLAAGAAGAATSYIRTKAYFKAVNADLFHPAGLHATILTTKKMVQEVGYPEERLRLPPLETMDDWEREANQHAHEAVEDGKMDLPEDDPRARRLQALEGYVTPLHFDVPSLTSPDNFLRKMSAASAARRAKKQEKKMREKREEGLKKQAERSEKRDKKVREGEKKMAELEKELAKERKKLDKARQKEKEEKKLREAEREYEKEEAKILRKMERRQERTERRLEKKDRKGEARMSKVDEKEEKTANGIRWIVITRWDGDCSSDEDTIDSLEDPSS